ncbi:hypothetical protein E5288_WYG013482 [Bos mutus]|uniref:Uncharacterized protein n=1 Tax=Bos mutus TaxID=72004 RepID=A0A6B0RZ18_9CETA|nr:hypothetical protein [Bos mutus]
MKTPLLFVTSGHSHRLCAYAQSFHAKIADCPFSASCYQDAVYVTFKVYLNNGQPYFLELQDDICKNSKNRMSLKRISTGQFIRILQLHAPSFPNEFAKRKRHLYKSNTIRIKLTGNKVLDNAKDREYKNGKDHQTNSRDLNKHGSVSPKRSYTGVWDNHSISGDSQSLAFRARELDSLEW